MDTSIRFYLLIYLAMVNLCTFLVMFADKALSRYGRNRVPEFMLLFFCAAGGSIGGFISMYAFRHKTRHRKFTVGIPLILLVQLALVLAYLFYCVAGH